MLSRNFQARVSFVSPALKLPLLQPAPRLVIPKFGHARELPPHPKSLPQPRHTKSPFYPSAGNEAPRRGVKTGGGTLVTYPTFRTSASLSLAPPPPSPPFVHRGCQNPRSSVGLLIAAQPKTLPRLRHPLQQLVVPHPPHRMRIRCRSRRPAGSAAPSSTSKELPRRSPHLSRHLNPHTAVLTYPTEPQHPHQFLR